MNAKNNKNNKNNNLNNTRKNKNIKNNKNYAPDKNNNKNNLNNNINNNLNNINNNNNNIDNINWYPGHMAKTRRMIEASLKLTDAVCEILDARIPISSRNPDIDALTADKPRLMILNRADQADPNLTARWIDYYNNLNNKIIAFRTDAKSGRGFSQFAPTIRELLSERINFWTQKGQSGHIIRVMILGVPNVGKSTFINRVAGRNSAKAENRPGVTRGKQWIVIDRQTELLDTPGILWPKFENKTIGEHLAWTGAIKDNILDLETLGSDFIAFLARRYPDALFKSYGLDLNNNNNNIPAESAFENPVAYGYELLKIAGARRGYKISGGEIDTERMSRVLFDEFRSGKLGRFTLESPEDII